MPPATTNEPSVPLQQNELVASLTLPPDTPKREFLVWYGLGLGVALGVGVGRGGRAAGEQTAAKVTIETIK